MTPEAPDGLPRPYGAPRRPRSHTEALGNGAQPAKVSQRPRQRVYGPVLMPFIIADLWQVSKFQEVPARSAALVAVKVVNDRAKSVHDLVVNEVFKGCDAANAQNDRQPRRVDALAISKVINHPRVNRPEDTKSINWSPVNSPVPPGCFPSPIPGVGRTQILLTSPKSTYWRTQKLLTGSPVNSHAMSVSFPITVLPLSGEHKSCYYSEVNSHESCESR